MRSLKGGGNAATSNGGGIYNRSESAVLHLKGKDVLDFLQKTYPQQCSAQLFSSKAKKGVKEVYSVLGKWLDLD